MGTPLHSAPTNQGASGRPGRSKAARQASAPASLAEVDLPTPPAKRTTVKAPKTTAPPAAHSSSERGVEPALASTPSAASADNQVATRPIAAGSSTSSKSEASGGSSTASRSSGSRATAQRAPGRLSSDSIGWYLSSIGRVPLLTPAEEIELAHHVQLAKRLQQENPGPLTPKQSRQVRMGQRARDRMMAANLRLVVSVAKKYQNQGLELLDLVQEGAIGLERAVDKFDPAMGYKFSTYDYWWIRQGMTRAIDNSARTIRLPIHISEKLSKMRRITRELSHRLGRQPNRLELAHAMGMAPEELEELLAQSAPCASLDAHARGEEDRSTLGELIADPASGEHFDSMDRHLQKEHLGTWLSQLNDREQKILKLRFGLEGSEPLTLAEIGRRINVSRERVRQLEAKAIMKLRLMSNRQQAA